MNHKLDNIFNPEDYRHKVYDLYQKHELGELTDDQLKDGLRECYQDLVEGAKSKNFQLMEDENPFWALWDNALQKMNVRDYDSSIHRIQDWWSDFTDYYFSMWYLRRTEELLNIKSEPLN